MLGKEQSTSCRGSGSSGQAFCQCWIGTSRSSCRCATPNRLHQGLGTGDGLLIPIFDG
jgi:hypothetical protein